MANENETVEQVCEEMRNDWAQLYFSEGTRKRDGGYSDVSVIETDKVSGRILAAHKRDIADFQRRYDECVRRFNEADLERVMLRDEVAAKDAEIDRGEREYIRCREELRATRERRDDCEVKMRKALERVTRAESALAAKDAEIASLRALLKEIARGFLEYEKSARFNEYGGRGVRFKGSVTTAFWHESADIAKKARGVRK